MASLLKRFLLFQGDVYYPCQAFGDFVDSFDTEEEAKAHPAYVYGQEDECCWSEVIDTWSTEDITPDKDDSSYRWQRWREHAEEEEKGKDDGE